VNRILVRRVEPGIEDRRIIKVFGKIQECLFVPKPGCFSQMTLVQD